MLHYSAMLPYLEYHPILKYGDNSTRQSIFYPVRLILFPYNILLHPRTYQLVSLTNWLMIGPIPDIQIIYIKYYFTSQMSELTEVQPAQTPKDTKTINRWNNISSDEDESDSEHSQKEVQPLPEAKKQQTVLPEQPQEENKKKEKEAHIVPFDPKKKFRGQFAHLKTVKGGFKAEKLQKKAFHLDTVKNPFAFVNDENSDSEEQKQEESSPTQAQPATPAIEEPEAKKEVKKSKKQQEKQQLAAFLKEINDNKAAEEGADKKKKKKKAKKAEGEEPKEEVKAEQTKTEETKPAQPAQEFKVDREAIEELMKKKAENAKPAAKKNVKGVVNTAAKRAIEEREAKNKAKKVFIDL